MIIYKAKFSSIACLHNNYYSVFKSQVVNFLGAHLHRISQLFSFGRFVTKQSVLKKKKIQLKVYNVYTLRAINFRGLISCRDYWIPLNFNQMNDEIQGRLSWKYNITEIELQSKEEKKI